jgi:hypothetical protein
MAVIIVEHPRDARPQQPVLDRQIFTKLEGFEDNVSVGGMAGNIRLGHPTPPEDRF